MAGRGGIDGPVVAEDQDAVLRGPDIQFDHVHTMLDRKFDARQGIVRNFRRLSFGRVGPVGDDIDAAAGRIGRLMLHQKGKQPVKGTPLIDRDSGFRRAGAKAKRNQRQKIDSLHHHFVFISIRSAVPPLQRQLGAFATRGRAHRSIGVDR